MIHKPVRYRAEQEGKVGPLNAPCTDTMSVQMDSPCPLFFSGLGALDVYENVVVLVPVCKEI